MFYVLCFFWTAVALSVLWYYIPTAFYRCTWETFRDSVGQICRGFCCLWYVILFKNDEPPSPFDVDPEDTAAGFGFVLAVLSLFVIFYAIISFVAYTFTLVS